MAELREKRDGGLSPVPWDVWVLWTPPYRHDKAGRRDLALLPALVHALEPVARGDSRAMRHEKGDMITSSHGGVWGAGLHVFWSTNEASSLRYVTFLLRSSVLYPKLREAMWSWTLPTCGTMPEDVSKCFCLLRRGMQ